MSDMFRIETKSTAFTENQKDMILCDTQTTYVVAHFLCTIENGEESTN